MRPRRIPPRRPITRSTTVFAVTSSSTTTTRPPLRRPLLCVIGQFADVKAAFPMDGLCDYIFYAEVVRLDNQIKASFNIESFNLFIEISKQYKDTSFGLSFHPTYATEAISNRNLLFEAFGRIKHINGYGMLNIRYNPEKDEQNWYLFKTKQLAILEALQVLRLAADKGPRPSQLVLGVMLQDPDHTTTQLLVERLYDATHTLNVTMVVFKSHFELFPPVGAFLAVGPNPFDTSLSVTRTMMEVAADLAAVNATYVNGTFVLMSVSMACMGYGMPSGWVEHEGSRPGYAPDRAMMMEQAETCRKHSGFESERADDTDPSQFLRGNSVTKSLIIYDTSESLKRKVRAVYNVIKQKVNNFGFAAYHVELDDFSGVCGYGRFQKLIELKATVKNPS